MVREPFLPDESSLSPDACTSSVKLAPIDSSLFPNPTVVKDAEVMPTLLSSDEEGHDDPEFGEFLLDAVDWL